MDQDFGRSSEEQQRNLFFRRNKDARDFFGCVGQDGFEVRTISGGGLSAVFIGEVEVFGLWLMDQ